MVLSGDVNGHPTSEELLERVSDGWRVYPGSRAGRWRVEHGSRVEYIARAGGPLRRYLPTSY